MIIMPMRPKKLCMRHGPYEGKECEPCRVHRWNTDNRQRADKRGYNHNWRKVRIMKLNRNPLCERCNVLADLVHHIDRDPWNNLEGNLESLCCKCHAKEHAND